MNISQAKDVAGSIGFPSKMPGTSYGIPATACKVGAKLATVEGSVCHGCYALKGNYLYDSVSKGQAKRLEGINHPSWTVAMVTLLTQAHTGKNAKVKSRGWHRWHDSGDLQSVEHLTKICAVASATPKIRHWLPTRELKMVQTYVSRGGTVPPNLTIRVSATMVDGAATTAWPTVSTVHAFNTPVGRVCPAPRQGNECKSCRSCWSRDVPNVSYHKH